MNFDEWWEQESEYELRIAFTKIKTERDHKTFCSDLVHTAWEFAEKQKDKEIGGVQKIIAGYMRTHNQKKHQHVRLLLNFILERLSLPKYKIITLEKETKVVGGGYVVTNELEKK